MNTQRRQRLVLTTNDWCTQTRMYRVSHISLWA